MTARSARVTTDWLALRGPADRAARDEGGRELADRLDAFLHTRAAGRPAVLVDVGAGTGAGAAWLHTHLSHAQAWVLLDHDQTLLHAAPSVAEGWATPVAGDLDRLPQVLAQVSAPAHAPAGAHAGVGARAGVDAVTCQALLDLLNRDDVSHLVDATVQANAAFLAALTVTGDVTLQPSDSADALVADAFNAHQRRGGRLGPDAADFAAALLRAAGWEVTVSATPWRLGSGPLMAQWLRGRAAAAAEAQPDAAAEITRWHGVRQSAVAASTLSAVVGHVDVLALPTR